ncbi:MAG TPA: TonB family protein [Bacteroidales bacterium]|nr:TonB family protein [Bacteroidales bacterium]
MKPILTLFFTILLCTIIQAQNTNTAPDDSIYTVVEQAPLYPGGVEALMKYLAENIQYPDLARQENIQGTVYVSFVVEKNGEVSNVKILRGIGGGCDEEAMRVVRNMSDWTPGYQNGEAVRVQFNLPLRFILTGPSFKLFKKKNKK